MEISKINDPFERFIAFIHERESIRLKRGADYPWPWTDDYILRTYRFTNINRENDRVSMHYQTLVRNHYGVTPLVYPATVLYRWFNRPETAEAFFHAPFEEFITGKNRDALYDILSKLPTPHITGAYVISSKTGFSKGEGVLKYFEEWVIKDWMITWNTWIANPPKLERMFNDVEGYGMGSFMKAQIVADLKYLPFMRNVEDWMTWAAPGPGSMRGLNVVLGHPMDNPWPGNSWHENLLILQSKTNPRLVELGIEPLHAQDLQNCLCEISKYEKVRTGVGRPRQVFRHG